MPFEFSDAHMVPVEAGQAVGRGWLGVTAGKPVGVTWHWSVTTDLAGLDAVLGGAHASRRGEASAHYGVGRSFAEGVHRYVALENRSWHAGAFQTVRWDGKPSTQETKGARTTVGIETVNMGYARPGLAAGPGWIRAGHTDSRFILEIQPWTEEQIEMMIATGKEIVARWRNIRPEHHHGHHDLEPGAKLDVIGFPFARVLRGIYDDPDIPDIWTPTWFPIQRQRILIALGYDLGPSGADGQWGRFSSAALAGFQRDQDLTVNGHWSTFASRAAAKALKRKGRDLAEVAGTE